MSPRILKSRYILIAIFLITLSVRLYFAFGTPNFTGEDAYFNLRQIESIKETGHPIFDDELSYGGRKYLFMPLFHYIIAFFGLLLPLDIACKLIPNILISILVFIVFSISLEITNDEKASLFAAAISSFIPVLFKTTLNDISPYSLALPLTLYALLCFMRLKKGNYLYRFLISFFILSLVHPSALLLIPIFLLYILLIKLEHLKQSRAEIEVILFSVFLVLWVNFLIYKNAFLFHGISVVWQNIPFELLAVYFSETSVLEAIYMIGSVPVIYGVYALYQYTFSKEQDRRIYLLTAFAFSIVILLWAKLLQPFVGFIYLGVIMTVFFAQFYKKFFLYVRKTRFFQLKIYFFLSIVFVFIITSLLPSIGYAKDSVRDAVSENEINALRWINDNLDEDAVILATLKEGHLITSVAKRKNVADPNFLFIGDADERLKDIRIIYKSPYETEATDLLNKYDVTHIYFSEKAKEEFCIKRPSYVGNQRCFKLVYKDRIRIYKSKCELE